MREIKGATVLPYTVFDWAFILYAENWELCQTNQRLDVYLETFLSMPMHVDRLRPVRLAA